jgi:alkylation response protein AidB-like acyl-CoA dehydrogenase
VNAVMRTLSSTCGRATPWIDPLQGSLHDLSDRDLRRLYRFETALGDLLAAHPVHAAVEADLRSRRLLLIREELARLSHLGVAVATRDGGHGRPPVIQTLMQFICGYHDVDLRDSTGLGHGRLISRHASPPVRDRWIPRLLAGALPGIAITEQCGGSRPLATATSAAIRSDGKWSISGSKTWISRLYEARVFCVFFTDPVGRLSVGVVDATSPGLYRRAIQPSGLSGWAWGELHLDDVRLGPRDLLGSPGAGMTLLREHFAHYRPLVAATALGAAAAACDIVADHLRIRRAEGIVTEIRDNALVAVGRAFAHLNAALLAACTTQRLSANGDSRASAWGCAIKAYGVDVAYTTTSELTLLVGALGFTADSALAKIRRDLNGLLYADGIHDSLYRAVGRGMVSGADQTQTAPPVTVTNPTAITAPARRTYRSPPSLPSADTPPLSQ